jgi:hypothetical protein
MADARPLIPLDKATACLWPHSATDQRLHLRIVAGDLTAEQRAWLAARNGRATILDPMGQGDCRVFWQGHARDVGWASDVELRREFGKLDCDLGKYFRTISEQLREVA